MEKIIRFRFIGITILLFGAALISFLVWTFFKKAPEGPLFDQTFLYFALAGFVAQIIDGALGMAYGVSCSTMLLSMGLPPAITTASVHIAEVFTTGASGLSHLYFGNVNKKLFLRLMIPGVIGGMLGAYLISDVFDGKIIKPYVSGYLVILGFVILYKAIRGKQELKPIKNIFPLGFVGGLLDTIGGGGWGPIVTSNLINKGNCPKETVGSVNTAEFFVTFFSAGIFTLFLGVTAWQAILGLILGGILAAPLGAYLVRLVKAGTIMYAVGVLVILSSTYSLLRSVGWL